MFINDEQTEARAEQQGAFDSKESGGGKVGCAQYSRRDRE
jgi:hypothetical protein